MSDKKPSEPTITQRALGPAADNFGREIAPVGTELGVVTAKVGRLLIAGLEKSVYGLDAVGAWIHEQVSERLKGVPYEKIVEPNPRIAVPATQALIYSMDDEYIRQMFANLLAADMNADTKSQAHPAFVEMIREMTSVEARVLPAFRRDGQVEFRARLGHGAKWNEVGTAYSFEIPGLDVGKISRAISNLRRMEVIELRANEWPLLDDIEKMQSNFRQTLAHLEKAIETSPEPFKQAMKFDGVPSVSVVNYGLFPTPFGQDFMRVCLPPK